MNTSELFSFTYQYSDYQCVYSYLHISGKNTSGSGKNTSASITTQADIR